MQFYSDAEIFPNLLRSAFFMYRNTMRSKCVFEIISNAMHNYKKLLL